MGCPGMHFWVDADGPIAQRKPTIVFPETEAVFFSEKPQKLWALYRAASRGSWLFTFPAQLTEELQGWVRPGGKRTPSLLWGKQADKHILSSVCR